MRAEDSQDLISAWIKGGEEVKILSALHSLYYKLLWLLTMEFLSPQQHRLTSHYLTCHEGCCCFLSQRRDAYIHTIFMPVFKNFGHIAEFQPNLVVILKLHGCRSLSREWMPAGTPAAEYVHTLLDSRIVCLGWAPGIADPKPPFSPKQNSMGSRFQCAVWLELGDHWKKNVPKAQVWPLNFPEYLI